MANTPTTKRKNKPGAGRPTLYRPEYPQQAYKYCLLGATNEKLAMLFEVSVQTIDNWLVEHEEFLGAVKAGRDEADALVAKSLFHRALGYEHKAVKIVADAKTGMDHTVEYVERYPPDTTAAIFWLKNRQREQWREKSEQVVSGETKVEHSGSVALVALDFDEVKKRIESLK